MSSSVGMESQCLSKDDTWQSILENELREKRTITPTTLCILKDHHEYCDPNVLMNLRHDKSTNQISQTGRESISSIMEAARRNLKTEYNEKASGALHKNMINNEVQKFKQHLARLKRINATSHRPHVRKPLRVRSQRMAIRSRSCGSSAAVPKPEREHSSDREINFFTTPPTAEFQWVNKSPRRVVSFDLDTGTSLAAYSRCEVDDVERGPNTTPVSFLNGILEDQSFSSKEEFSISEFCAEDSPPASPEPPAETRRIKTDEAPSDNGNFLPFEENQRLTDFKEETASILDSEKRRKVKNTAYKQFMSYVCNKSVRTPQVQIASSSKALPQAGEEERTFKKEKIALVLSYLQRKKSSPDSSVNETPPEPVTKATTKLSPTVSHDLKTARANGGPYDHRYQAQRDLIKKQKLQLQQQQKQIQELTFATLQEEAKNSQSHFQNTLDELEDDCSLSIRPQLKTLKGGGQPFVPSAGKIVDRMERREKERQERKQIAAERRKLMEEERNKKLQEEEEKRRKDEENKKREAFEKIREENIRQREIRERNRKEQERMIELHRRAELFNKRRLCKGGLRAFKSLLRRRDELIERAEDYYATKILKTTFSAWKRWSEERLAHKLAIADCFHKRTVLRNAFHCWKQELIDTVRRRQVADDMYEMRLQERVFRKWSQYANEQHVHLVQQLETADEYYTWVLLKRAFKTWQAYPKVALLERQKEQRKMILRQKVQDMLPDFRPVSPRF